MKKEKDESMIQYTTKQVMENIQHEIDVCIENFKKEDSLKAEQTAFIEGMKHIQELFGVAENQVSKLVK